MFLNKLRDHTSQANLQPENSTQNLSYQQVPTKCEERKINGID